MLEKLSFLRKRIFAPFLIRVNPSLVSFLSFILALLASYFFFVSSWLAAASFWLLSGFLDALDGEIARKYRLATKLGDLIDHTLDRLSDVAVFIALAFNPQISSTLALLTLITILLVSYAGTEAQALTQKRLYAAIVGRVDRIAILFFAALMQAAYPYAMQFALVAILILSAITFLQRTIVTARSIKP